MPVTLFTEAERQQILEAIRAAEKQTSGEIRLFLEKQCEEDVLDRAAFLFARLEMHKTKDRNGVLFYLATGSRKFAILGDAGIHQKVSDAFWNDIRAVMEGHFRNGRFVEGLSTGIRMSGDALKQHFPYQSGDNNELSDDIVFGGH